MSRLFRRSASTAALLILALLVAGAQHSLRLCRFSEHASQAAVAEPACPAHADPAAGASERDESRVPACCGPSVVLVSLPSLKGVAATEVAPARVFVSLESPLAASTLVAARGALQLAFDSGRPSLPYPHLRPNLALHTILV